MGMTLNCLNCATICVLFSLALHSDVNKIHEGLGDKIGAGLQWMSCCIAGLIIALVRGWKLALVSLSLSPLIAFFGGIMMKVVWLAFC